MALAAGPLFGPDAGVSRGVAVQNRAQCSGARNRNQWASGKSYNMLRVRLGAVGDMSVDRGRNHLDSGFRCWWHDFRLKGQQSELL